MITARFASHPGIFNGMCRWAQYGAWPTHCETVLSDGQRLGSWFHQGGVRIRPANYEASEGGFTKELWVHLKATPAQEEAFYAFLHAQIGKPYDWKAIVGFVISGRDWQEPDSWDCSELFASALAACGLLPQHMAVKFSRVTVRDVMLLTSMISEAG